MPDFTEETGEREASWKNRTGSGLRTRWSPVRAGSSRVGRGGVPPCRRHGGGLSPWRRHGVWLGRRAAGEPPVRRHVEHGARHSDLCKELALRSRRAGFKTTAWWSAALQAAWGWVVALEATWGVAWGDGRLESRRSAVMSSMELDTPSRVWSSTLQAVYGARHSKPCMGSTLQTGCGDRSSGLEVRPPASVWRFPPARRDPAGCCRGRSGGLRGR